jgi:hypothetical protein
MLVRRMLTYVGWKLDEREKKSDSGLSFYLIQVSLHVWCDVELLVSM